MDHSPLKMVGGTPLSPLLEVGTAMWAVPIPVAPADIVVGWIGGAVGTMGMVGGAVGSTMGTWVVGGNIREVWWVAIGLGRVEVFWDGLGGSASMAAVGWKLGCSGSEGSQYPRPKSLVTAMREVALVKKTPGCVESV